MELQKIYSAETKILTAFAESRIGGRQENQDSYGWKDTKLGYLVTVCDGMGGGPGGKTASTIAVEEIIAGIADSIGDEAVPNVIIKAIRRANMAIIERGNEVPALAGMGSTATVLLVNEKSAFIAHVGDSRVYQLRGHNKVFRTFDHSLVFDMVSQGVITEEQARLSAQSNVITRALGVKPDVEVEIHEVAYEKGDRFVLCSDGIHGTMPENELLKMFTAKNAKLGVTTDNIATSVDNLGRSGGGGHDNLTLAIVEMNINSKKKAKMSKQTKYIIGCLVALFAISLSLNMIQCSSRGSVCSGSKNTSADSCKMLKDSLQRKEEAMAKIDSLLQKDKKMGKYATDKIKQIMK